MFNASNALLYQMEVEFQIGLQKSTKRKVSHKEAQKAENEKLIMVPFVPFCG
jgi:hypothetical protein